MIFFVFCLLKKTPHCLLSSKLSRVDFAHNVLYVYLDMCGSPCKAWTEAGPGNYFQSFPLLAGTVAYYGKKTTALNKAQNRNNFSEEDHYNQIRFHASVSHIALP